MQNAAVDAATAGCCGSAAQHRVQRVFHRTFGPVAREFAVGLHVPGRRLDGAAPLGHHLQVPGQAASLARSQDAYVRHFDTALDAIKSARDEFSRHKLHYGTVDKPLGA